jgi:hypothetical protein
MMVKAVVEVVDHHFEKTDMVSFDIFDVPVIARQIIYDAI